MSVEGKAYPIYTGISVEPHEGILNNLSSRWFAGAFETGGYIGFRKYTKGNFQTAYPNIFICNTNEKFIDGLVRDFDGGKIPYGNSFKWELTGKQAAEIVVGMNPYVVSLREMTEAMARWLEADSSERLEIQQEMRRHNRYKESDKDQYTKLLEDPVFLAGVLDNRMQYSSDSEGYVTFAPITIESKNYEFLAALADQLGIESKTVIPKGTARHFPHNIEVMTKNPSNRIEIPTRQGEELIRNCMVHLRLPLANNWDMHRSDIEHAVQLARDNSLLSQVREELLGYNEGLLLKLSTAEELAQRYECSAATIRIILQRLPQEDFKKRQHLVKSQAQRDALAKEH